MEPAAKLPLHINRLETPISIIFSQQKNKDTAYNVWFPKSQRMLKSCFEVQTCFSKQTLTKKEKKKVAAVSPRVASLSSLSQPPLPFQKQNQASQYLQKRNTAHLLPAGRSERVGEVRGWDKHKVWLFLLLYFYILQFSLRSSFFSVIPNPVISVPICRPNSGLILAFPICYFLCFIWLFPFSFISTIPQFNPSVSLFLLFFVSSLGFSLWIGIFILWFFSVGIYRVEIRLLLGCVWICAAIGHIKILCGFFMEGGDFRLRGLVVRINSSFLMHSS